MFWPLRYSIKESRHLTGRRWTGVLQGSFSVVKQREEKHPPAEKNFYTFYILISDFGHADWQPNQKLLQPQFGISDQIFSNTSFVCFPLLHLTELTLQVMNVGSQGRTSTL